MGKVTHLGALTSLFQCELNRIYPDLRFNNLPPENILTQIFTVLVVAENWKQPRGPALGER